MFVHVADAVNKGYKKIIIRTVDTDVVVLAVAAAAKLDVEELCLVQLRVSVTYLLMIMRLLGHLGHCSAGVSCLHRVRHCIIFRNKGEEVSVDHLEL